MHPKAAILAGGKSRRMGRDKAMLRVCGKTFLERVIEALRDFEFVIVCRDSKQIEEYRKIFDLNCFIEDTIKDFGPLAGIHAALKNV